MVHKTGNEVWNIWTHSSDFAGRWKKVVFFCLRKVSDTPTSLGPGKATGFRPGSSDAQGLRIEHRKSTGVPRGESGKNKVQPCNPSTN